MPVPLGVKRGDFCRGSNERSDATAYESTIAALQRVGGGVTLAWVEAGTSRTSSAAADASIVPPCSARAAASRLPGSRLDISRTSDAAADASIVPPCSA